MAEHRQLRIQLPQRAPDTAAGSIVRWDEWGLPPRLRLRWPRRAPGMLLGWRKERRGYHSFEQQVPELEKFGTYDECENWGCDIRVVAGFSGSKADLSAFQSLDAMVEATAQNLIAPTTPQKLRENLSYPGVRIMRTANQGDYFARYVWDGRIFLMNDDGSHHFAAARHIAGRLPVSVPLCGKLATYRIEPRSAQGLLARFDIFVIPNEALLVNAFHAAMESWQASYLSYQLPRPYDESRRVLFLPKDDGRAHIAAQSLKEARVLELAHHLKHLVERQTANEVAGGTVN